MSHTLLIKQKPVWIHNSNGKHPFLRISNWPWKSYSHKNLTPTMSSIYPFIPLNTSKLDSLLFSCSLLYILSLLMIYEFHSLVLLPFLPESLTLRCLPFCSSLFSYKVSASKVNHPVNPSYFSLYIPVCHLLPFYHWQLC